jgi:hypothetical protein
MTEQSAVAIANFAGITPAEAANVIISSGIDSSNIDAVVF